MIAVARRQTAAEAWAVLVGGALGGVWRWRLELALVGVPYVAWRLLARSLGPLSASIAVGATVAAVVVTPGARGALWRWLSANRVRRAWRRAWLDVGLPRVAARRVWQVPAGELVRIRCSRGSSIPTVAAHAEQLAACLGAREVRVHRDPKHAAWGTALLVRRDPLDGVTAAVAVGGHDRAAVVVGRVPGRRRRAGRHGHDGAARAQPALGRRARRGQERGDESGARRPRRWIRP